MGKKHSNYSKIKIGLKSIGRRANSKIVLDTFTGIYYDTIKDVSIAYNLNYSTLKYNLNKNNNNNKTQFIVI